MGETQEYKGLKKSQLIALIIILALNVFWIICDIIAFSGDITFTVGVTMFEIIIAIIYTTYDYKKPHGNLMRYLLLLYVCLAIVILINYVDDQPSYVNITYLISIALVSYMAGRLDHYKQNLVISGIVLLCNVTTSYYMIDMIANANLPLNIINIGSCIGCVTVWLAIASGYIIRYKLHNEAGLTKQIINR